MADEWTRDRIDAQAASLGLSEFEMREALENEGSGRSQADTALLQAMREQGIGTDEEEENGGNLHGSPLHGEEESPQLADFLSQSPAYVVDEEEARMSPCLRRELRKGGAIVFSKGIVGPLDEEQQVLYCERYETLELTPKQEARLERFADASHACKAEVSPDPKGQRLEPYLACMERELARRERTRR